MSKEELAAWLVGILTVEPVERDFFQGPATPQGKGRSFGGQVIGQALMSAIKTVPDDRPVHSLHGYFIRPGDATAPVLYRVERDRDGGSFTTRRVVAIQNGAVILNLAASFQTREPGLSHQDQMPDVPGPDEIEAEEAIADRMADQLPEAYLKWLRTPRPVDFRPCEPRPPLDRSPRAPEQRVWMRASGPLPDDPQIHRTALAYISDYGLLGTSTVAHGKAFGDPDMQYASLDHAVWFHDDFRVDDWLLYVMDSPWAGGARGFNRGRIFTRDGRLVASVAQEGLIRNVPPKAK